MHFEHDKITTRVAFEIYSQLFSSYIFFFNAVSTSVKTLPPKTTNT